MKSLLQLLRGSGAWLLANKEWLFSGIGVAVFGLVFSERSPEVPSPTVVENMPEDTPGHRSPEPTPIVPASRAPTAVTVTYAQGDHDEGKDCDNHEGFVVTCENATESQQFASIAISPCKAVRVIGIEVIEASGNVYALPADTTRFPLRIGEGDKYSKVEIRYKSSVDNRTRVRSKFVDKSGICFPKM